MVTVITLSTTYNQKKRKWQNGDVTTLSMKYESSTKRVVASTLDRFSVDPTNKPNQTKPLKIILPKHHTNKELKETQGWRKNQTIVDERCNDFAMAITNLSLTSTYRNHTASLSCSLRRSSSPDSVFFPSYNPLVYQVHYFFFFFT